MQAEFRDRLAGYRFAARLRGQAGSDNVKVSHTDLSVVVAFVGTHPSTATRALFDAEGAIG
jgi:hypothetical protein